MVDFNDDKILIIACNIIPYVQYFIRSPVVLTDFEYYIQNQR